MFVLIFRIFCVYFYFLFFFFNDTATTEIYTSVNTLSLHDALPISLLSPRARPKCSVSPSSGKRSPSVRTRSEEHTSELQSLTDISYAVFCLKKKNRGGANALLCNARIKEQD